MNRKEVFIIAIGFFLTVVAWMIIDIYQSNKTPFTDNTLNTVQMPKYKNKSAIINNLKNRQ